MDYRATSQLYSIFLLLLHSGDKETGLLECKDL